MACPSSWRRVEIEQQTSYGFTEEVIDKVLKTFNNVKKFYYIKHGRDVLDENGDMIENKNNHIHLLLWFKDSQPTDALIKKFCIDGCTITENCLEKIKADQSAVAYLTHENADKPIYPRHNIISSESIDDIDTDIDKAVREKQLKGNNIRKAEIVDMIDKGIIKPYNISDKVTSFEYVTYKNSIESAFKYRTDKLRKEIDRSMQVIFIYGDSGSGKTTYAKKIAKERYGDSVFISSSNNDVLDGYGGQDVIILDDLRASSMSLSDLLKMTDNHTSSSVKSRFINKVLECKLLIITSIYDIDHFYRMVFESNEEPIKQLKRRCQVLVHFTKEYLTVYGYNPIDDIYEEMGTIPNDILSKYSDEFRQKTPEEKKAEIMKILGGTADLLNGAKKIIERKSPEAFEQLSFVECDNLPFDKTEV